MKRFVSSLLVLTLVFTMISSGVVFSAGGDYLASQVPQYELSCGSGFPGGELTVDISIGNNPGIISLRNVVVFDENAFELVRVEDKGLLSGFTTPAPNVKSPYTLRWADALAAENNCSNGVIATIVFSVKESTPAGSYTFSVEAVEARAVDGSKITFKNASADVRVSRPAQGDANGDGEVDDWDAILFERYLAGWNVSVFTGALDLDGDGEVSDWDAIILNRYLAGWHVEFSTPEPEATEEPSEGPRDISGETSMASSIIYASDMLNGVQGAYDGPDRKGFDVRTITTGAHIGLTGEGAKGLSVINNANGDALVSDIDGYVKTAGGDVFGTNNSPSARVNTNKMGVYYYEVNIRDLEFEADEEAAGYEQGSAIDLSRARRTISDVSNVSVRNGALSFTVTSSYDPYVANAVTVALDGCNTIAFDITSRGSSTGGELFYTYDGGTNYTADQRIPFRFATNCTKQRIYVHVPDFDGATGYLRGIRFDVNGVTEGDTFVIENVRLMIAPEEPVIKYGFEQTLHSYSDKIHSKLRLLYDYRVTDLAEFGERYTIPKNTVEKLAVGMTSGTVLESVEGTVENFEYIGFDIKNAGVFGVIVSNDKATKSRVYSDGENYVVELYLDVSGSHAKGSESSFGHRLYTSTDHTFDELANEAYCERNPLTLTLVSKYTRTSGMRAVGYDTKIGAYVTSVRGTDFNTAYYTSPNAYYGGKIRVNASDGNRKIYIYSNGASGCLESAALLDENKMLVPIQTEVCKNFSYEIEESYYDPKDPQWGITVFPLVVESGKNLTYTMLNLYQKWGLHALKQVSSISFHIGYYHLSTGVTESNCIAPYFVYGRDGWTLPDFRGCSGIMWSDQPQFNSTGRPKFLSYKDNSREYQSEYTGTVIRSVGPVYSDLDYSYRSYDGSISYTLRHIEFPSNDENRTYYVMTGEVLEDVTFENARQKFTLFHFDPRYQCMAVTKYKAEDGSDVTLTNSTTSAQSEKIYKLSDENPYFSLYDYDVEGSESDVENFGFIIRSFEMTVGGQKFTGGLVMRNSVFKDGVLQNKVEISADADTLAFKKGDTFRFVFILLPFGVAEQKDDHNVQYVIEDSVENPWRVASVNVGTVIEDEYLPMIKCVNDVAEFTLTGSRNANAVRVCGFTKLVRPKIQEYVDGTWVDYKYNRYDFDGYQVNFTDDGYFDYSFIVDMENCTDTRTFRVSVE
ncbi:MAG: hypothetical protein K6G89_05050 [Clostridia bacterium]|nr:hypothetical protein [Clostridia bacterium]